MSGAGTGLPADDAPAAASTGTGALAGVVGRHRSPVHLLVAGLFAAVATLNAVGGRPGWAVLYGAMAVTWVLIARDHPGPWVGEIGAESLSVRRGWQTRSIARSAVVGVRARAGAGGYGLEIDVRDGDPVHVPGTALRFSAADAQARALRRWAGLPG